MLAPVKTSNFSKDVQSAEDRGHLSKDNSDIKNSFFNIEKKIVQKSTESNKTPTLMHTAENKG